MSETGLTRRDAYGFGTLAGASAGGVEILAAAAQLWLLAQALGKQDFGRLAFALAVVQVLGLIASRGFERLIVYRISRDDEPQGDPRSAATAASATGWAVAVSCLLAAALWAAAPFLGAGLGDRGMAPWLRGLAPLLPITAVTAGYAAWHQACQRFAHWAIVGRMAPALVVTALLAAAWGAGAGAPGVVGALVGGRLTVALLWWAVRPLNLLRLRPLGRIERRYVVDAAAAGLVTNGLRQLDVLMLLPLAGAAVTAEYAVAARLASLLRAGAELITPVFTPRAGLLLGARRRDELLEEFNQTRAAAVLIGLCTAVPLVALGPQVLDLFGDYRGAYPALLILIAARLAMVAFGFTGVVLLMSGRAGWSFLTNLLLLLVTAALDLALIPLLGGPGAALAGLAAVLSIKTVTALIVRRVEGLSTLGPDDAAVLVLLIAGLGLGAAGLLPPLATAAVLALLLGLGVLRHRATVRAMGQWAWGRLS